MVSKWPVLDPENGVTPYYGTVSKSRIWCWFWICWKSWKKFHKKKLLPKTRRKYALLHLYSCSLICFLLITFLGEFLWNFFNRFKNQHEILDFFIPILNIFNKRFCLPFLALFANCKDKRRRNGSRKPKTLYVLEFNLATINGLGGSFL